jgi:hypothetical protein
MRDPLLAGAVACCLACQSYTAATVATVNPGNDIRIALTDQGTTTLATALGPHAVGLDGTVVTRDSTGIRLTVQQVRREDGTSMLLHGEPLRIPADAVATLEIKHLDVIRSVLLAGAVATGAALAANSAGGATGGQPSTKTPAAPK